MTLVSPRTMLERGRRFTLETVYRPLLHCAYTQRDQPPDVGEQLYDDMVK